MLRFFALAWLVLESAWVALQGLLRWPDPEGQVWLMDLGITFLVAPLLSRATPGRALLLVFGMLVWAMGLGVMASPGGTCGTHAFMVLEQAKVLVAVKLVLVMAAALRRP